MMMMMTCVSVHCMFFPMMMKVFFPTNRPPTENPTQKMPNQATGPCKTHTHNKKKTKHPASDAQVGEVVVGGGPHVSHPTRRHRRELDPVTSPCHPQPQVQENNKYYRVWEQKTGLKRDREWENPLRRKFVGRDGEMPMRVCVFVVDRFFPPMRRERRDRRLEPDRLVVLFAGRAAVNSHWESAGVVWVGCVGAGC